MDIAALQNPAAAKQAHLRLFQAVDLDQSGAITATEFKSIAAKIAQSTGNAALAEQAKGAFARIDANKDGQLTQDEFRAHHEETVQAYGAPPQKVILDPTTIRQIFMQAFEDANEDDSGGLNLEEFQALGEKRAERAGHEPAANLAQIFDQIDTNNDGEVSLREAENHLLEKHEDRRRENAGGAGLLGPDVLTALLANWEEES